MRMCKRHGIPLLVKSVGQSNKRYPHGSVEVHCPECEEEVLKE